MEMMAVSIIILFFDARKVCYFQFMYCGICTEIACVMPEFFICTGLNKLVKKLDSRASQSKVGYKRRVCITCSQSKLQPPNSPPKWALCKTPIDHRLSPSMSLSSHSSSSILQSSSRSSISSSQMQSSLSRMSRSASTHRTTHPSPISHSRH